MRSNSLLELAWWIVPLCGCCDPAVAQEITPFRLTSVEGYNDLRYVGSQFASTQPGVGAASGTSARQDQSDFREELFIMTHSYVYHPNLLSLDVGFGPVLQRSSYVDDAGETKSGAAFYNFSGRAKFLRDKPVQGSMYIEHLNPTLNVAPGQVMAQQSTGYGADFALTSAAVAVPTFVDFSRSHVQGRGADRIIDDQVDRFNLRSSYSFGALGSTQLQYHTSQQASSSGSPNLAIQGSDAKEKGLSIDSRFQFGPDRQYDISNLVSFNRQAYTLEGQNAIPDRKDARFFIDLRARHSRELQTFGSFNHSSNEQGALNSSVNSAAAGLNYALSPDLSVSAGLHTEDNHSAQLSASSRAVDGAIRYQQKLPLGVAEASYSLRRDQREQIAVAAQANIIGERATLTGSAYVVLAQQHVSTGSVVVVNATRTQTFVEGIDYLLIRVGAETRLQRLIGGAIVDGQDVLADYAYDLGGTFAYRQTDQTLNFSWTLGSYFNAYVRLLDSAPQLSSGLAFFPLNVVRSSLYGWHADVPLKVQPAMSFGASMERESRRETITPYRRDSDEIYGQAEDPFFGAGNVRLSLRHTRVVYDNALQNVDLRAYDLRYWARFLFGPELSASLSGETDTGGPTERRRLVVTAKAQWTVRKLKISADLGRTVETQGDFRRAPALLQLQARREF